MSPSTSLRTAAILATGALLLTGCSGEDIAETIAEQAGGGDVDIDSEDGSVSVETDEGSVNIGSQDLPEELPDELPLPDGLTVSGSMAQDGADGQTVGVQAQVDASFDETVAFFDEELEAAGWTIGDSTSADMNGLRSQTWQVEGFGWSGIVGVTQLGEDEPQTAVSINLESAA